MFLLALIPIHSADMAHYMVSFSELFPKPNASFEIPVLFLALAGDGILILNKSLLIDFTIKGAGFKLNCLNS